MLATRWSIATAGRTKSQTSTLPGPAFSRPPEPQTRPTRSSRCHCAGPSSWPPSGAPSPVDTGSGVKEVATLEREIGSFVLWVTDHPAVFRRLARHVMKRRLPEGNRAVEVVAMNDDGPDVRSPLS